MIDRNDGSILDPLKYVLLYRLKGIVIKESLKSDILNDSIISVRYTYLRIQGKNHTGEEPPK